MRRGMRPQAHLASFRAAQTVAMAPPVQPMQEACPKELEERKGREREAAAEVPQEGPARPANESRRERPGGSPTWPCGGEGRERGSILSSAS